MHEPSPNLREVEGKVREREEEGKSHTCESPTVMLALEGAFHPETGSAFTLSSVIPHQCAPAVLHLCAPLEAKLFSFILAALPGSRLPPYSFVLEGYTTFCCLGTFRCAFPTKSSVVLV